MSHHEEEGARFGYDGEQLAEDIRKEFAREGRGGEVNELSERAKGIYAAIQLLDYAELTDSQRDQEKCGVIEQALLAERRLAMEEIEQFCRCISCCAKRAVAKLRAAAEKEVAR